MCTRIHWQRSMVQFPYKGTYNKIQHFYSNTIIAHLLYMYKMLAETFTLSHCVGGYCLQCSWLHSGKVGTNIHCGLFHSWHQRSQQHRHICIRCLCPACKITDIRSCTISKPDLESWFDTFVLVYIYVTYKACPSILAGCGGTFVDVYFTASASKVRVTGTDVAIMCVLWGRGQEKDRG